MWLPPSIFLPPAPGDSHDTHLHTDGKTAKRLDYVLLPLDWFTSVRKAWVDREVDLANAIDDHSLAFVEVRVSARSLNLSQFHWPRVRVQAERLQDPAIREAFLQHMDNLQVSQWEESATAQCARIDQHMAEFAQQHLQPEDPSRQDWVSERTIQLLGLRRVLRAQHRSWTRKAHRGPLAVVFQA